MDEWKNALKHGAGRFCNRKHDRGKRMPSACQCEGGDEQAKDENGEEPRDDPLAVVKGEVRPTIPRALASRAWLSWRAGSFGEGSFEAWEASN
jgi:hypothetical protein